ncbi:unnamed protein product [Penicillium egyptiacum]|uniref:Uncharacterized protein n=1 Tax=Penicillium egyptiacum TaxID=1303716 RepID=A0A9W4KF45_9EURO|nr:unnamed protein product [Penicillium egyptiacum]
MREHWKRRHQQNQDARISHQKRLSRNLPLRSKSTNAHVPSSADAITSSALQYSEDMDAFNNRENHGGIPAQLLYGLSYALLSSRPNPFQTCPVHLTSQHQKLLHHWISTHAAMMFEDLDVIEFNPMKDVWFPLDLSNASSFNCIMAHSAAHLSHLYAGTPPRILRLWLGDPEKELSDDSFAAVVRLPTYERYWGTEQDWKIHRDGLQRMIEAKGGVEALHENWRLELVVYLVSLMSRPSWLEPTNNLDRISPPLFSTPIMQQTTSCDIQKVRCLWLMSFIQDMRTFMGSVYTRGLSSFPFTHAAVGLLRDHFQLSMESRANGTHGAEWEDEMLACLFCISVLIQESISVLSDGDLTTSTGQNTLDRLEISLQQSRHMWGRSIHNLRSILYESLTRLFEEGEFKVNYVTDLVHVLGALSLEARRGVEKCLLNLLYCLGKTSNMLSIDDGWSPDSLLSSMHGH